MMAPSLLQPVVAHSLLQPVVAPAIPLSVMPVTAPAPRVEAPTLLGARGGGAGSRRAGF
jgi:hypothetical protein